MLKIYRQRGFTLIEMQAFLAVTSVLMLLAIVWATQVMKFTSRIKSQHRHHTQLTRLSWGLRADVQMSQSMKVEDATRLKLQQGDQEIVYEILESSIRVERTVKEQLRREEYPLSPNCRIQWQTDGLPESIGLIVTRLAHKPHPELESISETEITSLPIDIHIVARKGRWHVRFPADQSLTDTPAKIEIEKETVTNGGAR